MNHRKSLIIYVIFTLALLSGCSGNPTNKLPPNFTLSDLNGTTVSLNQFAGEPVLINFWRLDCPECVNEMPYIQTGYVNNTTATNMITIAIRDAHGPLTQFITDNNYSFPVLQDKFGTVAADYNIRFTPTTYLINSEGEIVEIKIGPFADLNDLEKALNKLG